MISNGVARQLSRDDLADIMSLYQALSQRDPLPPADDAGPILDTIMTHPGTALFGTSVDGTLRAMCTLHILPNMTRRARPYALIENVVSDPAHRGQGHARAAMETAIAAAWDADCYKIMLLSGSVDGHGFYPRLGFDGDAKRGFVLRRP